MSTPQDLLHSLARAYVLTLERDVGDPDLVDALEDVREAHEVVGWLVVRVQPLGLLAGGDLVPDTQGDTRELRNALLAAGILELRLQGVMEPEVLEDLLRRLHPSYAPAATPSSSRFRGLEDEVGLYFERSQVVPPGLSGSIQRLFGFDDLPLPHLSSPVKDNPVAPTSAADAPSSPSSLPPDLEEEVWALLRDLGPSHGGRLARLREVAGALQEARDVAALANLVQFLVEAVGETPEHEDVLEFAQEITSPAVASHLVARLGGERDEVERHRLTRVAVRLGREAAVALTDALGEARDRFQRRSYMEALSAMGPLAMEMAQSMVQDPRWFVVRNGVAVLGEIGGEEVVSHITATLGHQDHRVRRESVLALGKLGGDDAVQLLLGMMDDPEAEVRAASCRALGALKVERALRPLLTILESDPDDDVRVECLRALGELGDPGAVPLIEKKAVGRLFSRPPREVRIAAYRALAGIGTPHAMTLLEKAAEDSDTSIRTVARALLAKD